MHKIYEIHMPKDRNPPTKYEIHCLKIEIHKGHTRTACGFHKSRARLCVVDFDA